MSSRDGDSLGLQLRTAALRGASDSVESLLSLGVDPDGCDQYRTTALMFAALTGSRDVVQLLIANGANVNAQEVSGRSALMLAAQTDCDNGAAIVDELIERGADVEAADDDGMTALMLAAWKGNRLDVVESLLRHTSSSECAVGSRTSRPGRNALLLAAEGGHCAVVQLLLQHGFKADVLGQRKRNVLMVSAEQGHQDVVEFLATSPDVNVNAGDEWNTTALMLAAENGHREMVSLLIRLDADVNARDLNGRDALAYASLRDDVETVRLLVEKGADIGGKRPNEEFHVMEYISSIASGNLDAITTFVNEDGIDVNAIDLLNRTAITEAAVLADSQVIRLLVELGADLNLTDRDGDSALMLVLDRMALPDEAKRAAIVRTLCECGINVNAASAAEKKCASPLSVTIDRGFIECTKILIEHGADVRTVSGSIWTPLMFFVNVEDVEMTRQIVEGDAARLDATDRNGKTALTMSCINGNCALVELLLEYGARVDHLNQYGFSPLHYAEYFRQHQVIKLLTARLSRTPTNTFTGSTSSDSERGERTFNVYLLAAMFGDLDRMRDIREALRRTRTASSAEGRTAADDDSLMTSIGSTVRQIFATVLTRFTTADTDTKRSEVAGSRQTQSQVRRLLNGRNVNGMTALTLAATKGHVNVVQFLIDNGCCFTDDRVDADGANALIAAAKHSHSDVVHLLLRRSAAAVDGGADAFLRLNDALGRNALHYSLVRKDRESVDHFVRLTSEWSNFYGFDDGKSVLHYAAENCWISTLHLLAANVHLVQPYRRDNDGYMSLERSNLSETESALFVSILNPERRIYDSRSTTCASRGIPVSWNKLVQRVASGEADVDERDVHGLTALHVACYVGRVELVHELLAMESNVVARDKFHRTPLHLAATVGAEGCVIQLFTALGRDEKDEYIAERDVQGNTCVHNASSSGTVKMLELLLGQNDGADRECNDDKSVKMKRWRRISKLKNVAGQCPLAAAHANNNLDVLQKFLEWNIEESLFLKPDGRHNNHEGVLHEWTEFRLLRDHTKSSDFRTSGFLVDCVCSRVASQGTKTQRRAESPLFELACCAGDHTAVRALLTYQQQQPQQRDRLSPSDVHSLLFRRPIVSFDREAAETAIHFFGCHADEPNLDLLTGSLPPATLSEVVRHSTSERSILSEIVKHELELLHADEIRSCDGDTNTRFLSMLERLLRLGFSANITCGTPLLHLSLNIGNGALRHFVLFTEYGADVNARDFNTSQPVLHHLVEVLPPHSAMPFVNVLINRNVDLALTDNHGDTALHALLKKRETSFQLVNHLCDHMDDIDSENIGGDTPLILASRLSPCTEKYNLCEKLVERLARLGHQNCNNETVLHSVNLDEELYRGPFASHRGQLPSLEAYVWSCWKRFLSTATILQSTASGEWKNNRKLLAIEFLAENKPKLIEIELENNPEDYLLPEMTICDSSESYEKVLIFVYPAFNSEHDLECLCMIWIRKADSRPAKLYLDDFGRKDFDPSYSANGEEYNVMLTATDTWTDRLKMRIEAIDSTKSGPEAEIGSWSPLAHILINSSLNFQLSDAPFLVHRMFVQPYGMPRVKQEQMICCDECSWTSTIRTQQSPRGKVFIWNNYKYESKVRGGSQCDVYNLVVLFLRLGFLVESWCDLTRKNYKKRLRVIAKDKRISALEIVIVIVMGHGSIGKITLIDESKLDIEMDIIKPFLACPSVRTKAKMFLFAACRKERDDPPTSFELGIADTKEFQELLVEYSTYKDSLSSRDRETGSIYVANLVEQVYKLAEIKHLVEIVTATRNVVTHLPNIYMLPETSISLTKDVYLMKQTH